MLPFNTAENYILEKEFAMQISIGPSGNSFEAALASLKMNLELLSEQFSEIAEKNNETPKRLKAVNFEVVYDHDNLKGWVSFVGKAEFS